MFTRLLTLSFSEWPKASGEIVCVFEIPSKAYSYGNFATELSEARRPDFSAP